MGSKFCVHLQNFPGLYLLPNQIYLHNNYIPVQSRSALTLNYNEAYLTNCRVKF